MSRSPYTGDASKAVLSFANTNGGDVFAHWLRGELMKELGYFSPNAIYLDNVASRQEPGAIRHSGGVNPFQMSADNEGVSIIGPNTFQRDVTLNQIGVANDGRYLTIGAVHSAWFEMWKTALNQSKILLQVQTSDYFEREACIKEMQRIEEARNSGAKFHTLALKADDLPDVVVGSDTTPIYLIKAGPVSAHLPGSWKISATQVGEIASIMKAYGC